MAVVGLELVFGEYFRENAIHTSYHLPSISFDDGYTDPFVDPPVSNQMAVPKHALSPIYSVNFPEWVQCLSFLSLHSH